jgi:hypothetical protein
MPSSRQSRILGLWTAAWLFVLLLVLLLRFGDIRLQWPALLVPVVWALVALARGRRRRPAVRRPHDDEEPWPPAYDVPPPAPPERRLPPTRELPWLPGVARDRDEGYRHEEYRREE